MKVEIKDRYTVRQALHHPWMHRFGHMTSNNRQPNVAPSAKRRNMDVNMS